MKIDAYCSSGSSPPATNSNRSPLYVVNLHTIDALVPVIEQAVEHGTYEANELRFIAVAERAKLNFAEWSLQNLEPLFERLFAACDDRRAAFRAAEGVFARVSLVGKALKLLDGQFYRVPDTLTPDERFDALHIRLYAAEVTLAVGRAMLGRTTSDFARKVAKFESLLKKNAPTRPADTIALSLRAA